MGGPVGGAAQDLCLKAGTLLVLRGNVPELVISVGAGQNRYSSPAAAAIRAFSAT